MIVLAVYLVGVAVAFFFGGGPDDMKTAVSHAIMWPLRLAVRVLVIVAKMAS